VAALHPTISEADWALGNLEGAVGPAGDCEAMASPGQSPCFSVRCEDVALLREIGFKAMGMENNHSLDLGPAGRQATRSALVKNGLTPLTFERSPHFIRFGDVTLGLLTFSMVSNRGMVQEHRVSGKIALLQPSFPGFKPCPDRTSTDEDATDLDGLRSKLRQARNLANFVIVYVHWGSEFLDWPDEKQRRMALWLVRNGADIIVGHHPHVVQKPEILHGKPVFYSLGNFLFDQRYPATKEGLLADCRIFGDTARCSALTTHTPASSTYPAVAGVSGEAEEALAGCVLKAGRPLTVNGIVLRPHKDSGSDGLPGLVLEAERENSTGKTLWKSPRARIVSIEKMRVERSQEGQRGGEYLFTLEPHYSPMDGEGAVRPCVYEARPDGLTPKWRGTALAWPLKDATLLPGEDGILCALHRGDSFIMLQPESRKRRVAAYRWNGFGFSGIHDPNLIKRCEDCFEIE
jgi:poly-gamma-glutamate synthesis protein (capsule biosynthesis protein)